VIDLSRAPLSFREDMSIRVVPVRLLMPRPRGDGCVSAVTEARSRRTGNQKAMSRRQPSTPQTIS